MGSRETAYLKPSKTSNYGTIGNSSTPEVLEQEDNLAEESGREEPLAVQKKSHGLHRGLSSRQVQMIAIGGTIGTGLFLGTGRSLAQGGPGSVLICYSIIGFIVYVTLLLLGEMGTQYPVSGAL